MNRTIALLAAIAFFAVCPAVDADYSVWDTGAWPKSWPQELDPLRKQSSTLEGPLQPHRHYLIPFTKREEFEAAWPHLLKVKSKGVPIILVRGPKTDFFAIKPAGVLIHSPPVDADKEAVTRFRPRMQRKCMDTGGRTPPISNWWLMGILLI